MTTELIDTLYYHLEEQAPSARIKEYKTEADNYEKKVHCFLEELVMHGKLTTKDADMLSSMYLQYGGSIHHAGFRLGVTTAFKLMQEVGLVSTGNIPGKAKGI